MVGSIALTVDYDYHQSRNKIINNYFISKSYKKRIIFYKVYGYYGFDDGYKCLNISGHDNTNKNYLKIYE